MPDSGFKWRRLIVFFPIIRYFFLDLLNFDFFSHNFFLGADKLKRILCLLQTRWRGLWEPLKSPWDDVLCWRSEARGKSNRGNWRIRLRDNNHLVNIRTLVEIFQVEGFLRLDDTGQFHQMTGKKFIIQHKHTLGGR